MERKPAEMDIQYLPGVGPRRAALLKSELEVSTVGDLVRLYPFRYIDRSTLARIADITPGAAFVQFIARVKEVTMPTPKRLSAIVADDSGEIELVFFKGIKWMQAKLVPGEVFLFFGKPAVFNGKMNMVHPEVDKPSSGIVGRDSSGGVSGTLTGVYPSTEKLKNAGITGKVMLKLMAEALSTVLPTVEETLPEYVMKEKGLVPLSYALRQIHFPQDSNALAKATYRLKFEELFFLQLSLLKQKYIRSRGENGIRMPLVGEPFNKCYDALPYTLTGSTSATTLFRILSPEHRNGLSARFVTTCEAAAR